MNDKDWLPEIEKNLKLLRKETDELARRIATEEDEDRKLLLQIFHAQKETQQMITGIATMLGMRHR